MSVRVKHQRNNTAAPTSGCSAVPNIVPKALKASARSKPNALAGAIAGILRQQSYIEVHAIGARAVNQAIKAIAIAANYLKIEDIRITCLPTFQTAIVGTVDRTMINLRVEVSENTVQPTTEE